jgi:hypothetical protein
MYCMVDPEGEKEYIKNTVPYRLHFGSSPILVCATFSPKLYLLYCYTNIDSYRLYVDYISLFNIFVLN